MSTSLIATAENLDEQRASEDVAADPREDVHDAPAEATGALADPETGVDTGTATGPGTGQETGSDTGSHVSEETLERLSHRRALLDPVAGKLLGLLEQHRELDSPSQITIKGASVHVSRWERELVLQHHGDGVFEDRGWVTRVLDAVSFQARVLIDMARLGDDNEAADARAIQQLVLTSAVGLALKVELQKTVDRLVVSGDVATARHLSETLGRIATALVSARGALVRSDTWPAAVELAPGITCIPADAALPEAPVRPRRRRRRQPTQDELEALRQMEDRGRASRAGSMRKVSRVRAMVVLLLVLTVTWTAIVLLPMLATDPLPTLSMAEFRTVPQVRDVVARPPSLYVTINERDWAKLSDESRTKVLDQIGEIAARAEYTGAVVRTPEGVTVGQWLVKSGTSLIKRPD